MKRELAAALARPKRELTETQKRIVDAALALFSRRGFEGTTTAEIARRAKVTEKTLFSHFRTKQQLYAAVAGPALVATVEPLLFDKLRQVLSSAHPTFAEAVRAIAGERLEFARGAPETLKLVAQEVLLREEFRQPLIAYWSEAIFPGATRLIEQARDRGELRDVPTATVLRTLLALVIGLALETTVLSPEKAQHADRELESVLDVFLHGVLAKPAAPR